jgi:SAM-dependent methyltransferase
MDLSNADFWESQWQNQNTKWDLGKASPAICNFIDQYPYKKAKILIPGCGNAYEAQYLIAKGFDNITLVDISQTAVNILNEKFNFNSNIKVLCEDLFNHQGLYDLILEQTFFCAINPSLRSNYVTKMNLLLNTNGCLAGLLFNRNFEDGPPFGGSIIEYKNLFSPLFTIEEMEVSNLSIPARKDTELFIKLIKK